MSTRRLLHIASVTAFVAVLTACTAAPSPTPTVEPTATSTPYVYPDLPGRIEETIAESDCEDLEGLLLFLNRDDVDDEVRLLGIEAILHRQDELGGCD